MEQHKKRLRLPFYIVVLGLFLVTLVIIRNYQEDQIRENLNVSKIEGNIKIDISDTTISMAVIGDIMCHNTQYNDAYNRQTNTYDFSYVFDDIKQYIEEKDIAIGNLETTFAGKEIGYSSYPTFNTPEALATDLKELGIEVVSTANNHSLDKGYNGIASTIKELDKIGMYHTGTYSSKEESENILMLDVNGIKMAFLSYTYGTNGIPIPKGREYCINMISDEKIISDLEKTRRLNPDLIVISMHWGIEYEQLQNKEQERLANLLFENGVDIILGSHPHVLQKMEKREITLKDGTKKDGFVIYSLGNFISGQVKNYTRQSVILDIAISKNGKNQKISIDSVKYTPIYMSKTGKYKLLDIEEEIQNYEQGIKNIDKNLYETLKQELIHVNKILGKQID